MRCYCCNKTQTSYDKKTKRFYCSSCTKESMKNLYTLDQGDFDLSILEEGIDNDDTSNEDTLRLP